MMKHERKKPRPNQPKLIATIAPLAGVIVTALAGCATIDPVAPIASNVLDPTIYTAKEFSQFDQGRDIYLNQCNTCHDIEPIDSYTLSEWNHIIPPMAEESGLTLNETKMLTDYILTVRQVMPLEK